MPVRRTRSLGYFGGAPAAPSDGRRRVMVMPVDVTERIRHGKELVRSFQDAETHPKEVHHRVRNNPHVVSSILGLRDRKTNRKRRRYILTDSRNRIHAMAMIHEKLFLSVRLAEVKLSENVRELVDQIPENRLGHDKQIEVRYELDALDLNQETVIPSSPMINELVSSALEHAFPRETRHEQPSRSRQQVRTRPLSWFRTTGSAVPIF